MTFLPIVERELRIAARRRRTYVSRSVVAGLMVLLWVSIFMTRSQSLSPAELARTLFWTYGILLMVYALLCGVFFTADALSAERREGTLGLLFLTDLKGYDVVLGKLVATSWYGLYSLLVVMPILTLPLLMGGVSYAEMGRLIILILGTSFYSLALGLLISTICRRLVVVVAFTFLVLFLQCAMPWLVALLLDELTHFGLEYNPLLICCPFTPMVFLTDVSYRSGIGNGWVLTGLVGFWLPTVVFVLLGVSFLWISCCLLPRVWRRDEQPASNAARAIQYVAKAPVSEAAPVGSSQVFSRKADWMERNPYRWLAGRHRKMNRALSGILMGLTALWSVFLCLSFSQALNDFAFAVAILGAFSLHVLIKGWLALEASRRFCEDRQSGAMELLLVTSISEENILRGEFGAIKQSFAFPLIVAFGINVALILSIVVFNPLSLGYERWWFVNAGVMGAIILWLDARALAYTGMLTGLKFTRHHRAVLSALGRVIIPPWGAVVFFFLFILLPGSGLGRRDLLVAMNAWFFLCAALDIALIGHAKWSLRQKLRRICAGEERLGQGFESPECYTDAEEAK